MTLQPGLLCRGAGSKGGIAANRSQTERAPARPDTPGKPPAGRVLNARCAGLSLFVGGNIRLVQSGRFFKQILPLLLNAPLFLFL